MGIFSSFHKNNTILLRCSFCSSEHEINSKKVRLLEQRRAYDSICSVKQFCHFCEEGFLIPVNYKDKNGKTYLFHEIKPITDKTPFNLVKELDFMDTSDTQP